ncbi:MAG: hypothetical protein U1E45_22105 [Geminicoccaceae bacterium]
MDKKDWIWTIVIVIVLLVFLGTGAYILYYTQITPSVVTGDLLKGDLRVAYGFHLVAWMVLGMFANYFWDLFKAGKQWADFRIEEVLLPLFVAPIVFYTIWTLWPGKDIAFTLCLIAFQNGFFWQSLFSRAVEQNNKQP